MSKAHFVAGLLALAFFTLAQYQGWNLFDRAAGTQTAHVASGASRMYHK